jgi:hypothetical protein
MLRRNILKILIQAGIISFITVVLLVAGCEDIKGIFSKKFVRTGKKVYAQDEPIVVYFNNLPGNKQDWITIVPSSAPADKYKEWSYTNGQQNGKFTFQGLNPGDYEARVYFNWPSGGYNIEGRYAFTVTKRDVTSAIVPPGTQSTGTPRKADSGTTGKAIIVKDGLRETYVLKTGFFSETRFGNPKRASIQFQKPADEHSNARRIEITLDATKAGNHYADGKAINDSMFKGTKINVGSPTSFGSAAIFRFVADGGQIFPPKESCIINITSPYSGAPDGTFSGEINNCTVRSAGIDYRVSSVKFTMKGVPSQK